MITISDQAKAALSVGWTMHTRVSSWRSGTLLAADIPITAGRHETDASLRVPDRVTLEVPRYDAVTGTTWDPEDDPTHPLACYGQRLLLSLGIGIPGGVEWIQRGWFAITDVDSDHTTVRVTALNLLSLLDEARLTAPYQPTGTLGEALRALCEPALIVDLTAAPADRSCPAAMAWDEDRLAAVLEILDSWPAVATVAPSGALVVTEPPTPGAAVATLDSTSTGLAEAIGGSISRSGASTCVVARGTDSNGLDVQAVVYDTSGGPLDSTGPFSALPVPFFYYSPLLTTVSQCSSAALTIMIRRQSQAGLARNIECAPHPALLVGDRVTTDQGVGTVQTILMPLTAGDGTMSVTVVIP